MGKWCKTYLKLEEELLDICIPGQASLVAQIVKYLPQCRRPGFSLWVGKIPWRKSWQPAPVFWPGESPWTEQPGGLQFMGSQRVGHNWVTKHSPISSWLRVLRDMNSPLLPSSPPFMSKESPWLWKSIKASRCRSWQLEVGWSVLGWQEGMWVRHWQHLLGSHSEIPWGWDVEKRELLYTVGRNVNRYSYCAKYYGGFSKN